MGEWPLRKQKLTIFAGNHSIKLRGGIGTKLILNLTGRKKKSDHVKSEQKLRSWLSYVNNSVFVVE